MTSQVSSTAEQADEAGEALVGDNAPPGPKPREAARRKSAVWTG